MRSVKEIKREIDSILEIDNSPSTDDRDFRFRWTRDAIIKELKEIKRIVDVFERYALRNYEDNYQILDYCSKLQEKLTRIRARIKEYKNIK